MLTACRLKMATEPKSMYADSCSSGQQNKKFQASWLQNSIYKKWLQSVKNDNSKA